MLATAAPPATWDEEDRRLVRQLAGELAADLDDIGHGRFSRLVIHGDFTNHNVIAARRAAPALWRYRLCPVPRRVAARRYRIRPVAQRPTIRSGDLAGRAAPAALCPRLRVDAAVVGRRRGSDRGVPARPRPAKAGQTIAGREPGSGHAEAGPVAQRPQAADRRGPGWLFALIGRAMAGASRHPYEGRVALDAIAVTLAAASSPSRSRWFSRVIR